MKDKRVHQMACGQRTFQVIGKMDTEVQVDRSSQEARAQLTCVIGHSSKEKIKVLKGLQGQGKEPRQFSSRE